RSSFQSTFLNRSGAARCRLSIQPTESAACRTTTRRTSSPSGCSKRAAASRSRNTAGIDVNYTVAHVSSRLQEYATSYRLTRSLPADEVVRTNDAVVLDLSFAGEKENEL